MTETKTNARVTVENGWAVRDLPNGDQVRARLIPDPYPSEPERGAGMWNSGVSLVRERDSYRGIDLDDHDGLWEVLDRLYRVERGQWAVANGNDEYLSPDSRIGDDDDREEFVRRYLRAFHDVQHVSLRRHSGHGGSDWADIWVIVEGVEEGADVEALADATWSEWDAWAKGDVYTIESQTRTLADAMSADADDPDDGWEDDEHSGGYYGDDDATAGLTELLGVDEADLPALCEVTSY